MKVLEVFCIGVICCLVCALCGVCGFLFAEQQFLKDPVLFTLKAATDYPDLARELRKQMAVEKEVLVR